MSKRYAVFLISVFLAIPLWAEFREPNQLFWNVFLATFLIAVIAVAFFGLRYLERNHVAVGEAQSAPHRHDINGK
ncbi:hypothetical protein [Sphingomonas faeni]|uniref:hypothetical protein n=1 Tax=Sphingomonas faeni TaxID=185950 RepID=UPI00335F4048